MLYAKQKTCGFLLLRPTGQHIVVQPHENNCASMLEALCAGLIQHFEKPKVLSEPLGGLAELGRAVLRLQMRKCWDDVGLTAEVLKHAPAEFWEHLLSVYNDILCHGTMPRSWCQHTLLIFDQYHFGFFHLLL